jgi:hypothetical protein
MNYAPTVDAAAALQVHDSSKAIEALAKAQPYELGETADI